MKFGDKIEGVAKRDILLQTAGGKQKVTIINERLLYELIFQSQTQKAFVFQQWVFGEVLPSLRKHGEYRMNGKLLRRSLTDTIRDEIINKSESENVRKFAYSNFSKMINKSLGLPDKVNRDELPDEMLERIARRENLVQSLISEGKTYHQIKSFIENDFKTA